MSSFHFRMHQCDASVHITKSASISASVVYIMMSLLFSVGSGEGSVNRIVSRFICYCMARFRVSLVFTCSFSNGHGGPPPSLKVMMNHDVNLLLVYMYVYVFPFVYVSYLSLSLFSGNHHLDHLYSLVG